MFCWKICSQKVLPFMGYQHMTDDLLTSRCGQYILLTMPSKVLLSFLFLLIGVKNAELLDTVKMTLEGVTEWQLFSRENNYILHGFEAKIVPL